VNAGPAGELPVCGSRSRARAGAGGPGREVEGLCVGCPGAGVSSEVTRNPSCCGEQGLTETFEWNGPGPWFMGNERRGRRALRLRLFFCPALPDRYSSEFRFLQVFLQVFSTLAQYL